MHNLLFAYLFIWAVILGRLGFDEWQQWRASRRTTATPEDRQKRVEYEPWRTATT